MLMAQKGQDSCLLQSLMSEAEATMLGSFSLRSRCRPAEQKVDRPSLSHRRQMASMELVVLDFDCQGRP